jgi:DNA repair exonuclease SbcCD ATPase subunit
MSGLRALHRLRTEVRDGAQDAFARRLAELRLAEDLLRRATARWESQRGRCSGRAAARLSVLEPEGGVARAVLHARHEARLRGELEALAFGRDVARRELAARSERAGEARNALERAEASLAVLERLLDRREYEERRQQLRSAERMLDEHAGRHGAFID